jgi:hypothetical protein
MLELYIFDQNIKKNQKNEKEKVYFVSKNDIDEWKESTNYENIKRYLFKDNDILKYIEYDIYYQLFKFYKDQKKNIKHINFLYFKSKEELENYIKENSLVIVNQNFYNLLNEEKEKIREQNIFFSAKNDRITIYIDRKEIDFPFNGNNIVYSVKESYIRILLKIYYFQEELNNNINKSIDDNKNIKIGLIQKDWIKQFKFFFEYDYLKGLIKSNEMNKANNYSSFSESII